MACVRATHTTLQAIFLHCFCVTVVVGNEFITCQHVIGTQAHGIGFLAVRAFTFRLLFLGFPALSCYYRYNSGMNVRCVLIHVQDCRNGIFLAEGAMKPLKVVITPFVKSALVLYFHHILVRTRKHDSDCPYLVGGYLTFDACRTDTVAYCFGTVGHSIGKLHQFTVEMCTCRVCVLGYGLTFYVVGCARVSRAFRFVDLNAYISHACFSFSGLTNWFVGSRLLRSCRMANGGVQRGVTPLAHWGVFSCACTA